MKRLLGLTLGLGLLGAPAAALACGAFFASEVEVSPNQTIFVSHRAGIETYVFRPHFCGEAKDFGVILPIPSKLEGKPVLAENALYTQLETYTAPEVQEVCKEKGGGIGCGATADKGLSNEFVPDSGSVPPVNVVDRGRVGAFEYVLLQALTVADFTTWLDANGFPHGDDTSTYAPYVTRKWYFVAFKVSADTAAPPAGKKLCGDLGPIQVTFAATDPVVPATIAGVNKSGAQPTWRVALASSSQWRVDSTDFSTDLYFSGALTETSLSGYAELAAFAHPGERLTVLDVTFPNRATGDITFLTESSYDKRKVRYVTKDCGGGCSTGGATPGDVLAAITALGTLASFRRRRAS